MKKPKVSVLMTAYNAEKHIAEAIDSILAQTFTDFEFIIINDGSRDNTVDIIRSYDDNRINFIDNTENQGLIVVLNQGLDLCRGEYIARMDSDDIARPGRLEAQVNYMDSHPECAVCGAAIQKFGPGIQSCVITYPRMAKYMELLQESPVAHPVAMIRAATLNSANLRYDIEYPHAEDYNLWVDLIKYGQIHNLPDVLLNYRIDGSNISIVKHQEQLKTMHKIEQKILNILTDSEQCSRELYGIVHETVQWFYLFGFLPVVKRKQYAIIKTKYNLFGKIPLILLKNNGVLLFGFIKIGKIKGEL